MDRLGLPTTTERHPMTPEEALKLRDLAPAGKLQIRPAKHLDGGTRSTINLVSGVREIAEFPVGKIGEGYARVLYASRDALATIAELQWEYGVEQDDVTSNPDPSNPGPRRWVQWCASEDYARTAVSVVFRQDRNPRLVRRIVGPVEVVE